MKPIIHHLFEKTEAGGTFLNSILSDHYPNTKTGQRYYKKRKLYALCESHEPKCKNPQKIIRKLNATCIKRITHYDQIGFSRYAT